MPTPWPEPRPVKRYTVPTLRSSKLALRIRIQPSVGPTAMRRSWPEISEGVIPSSTSLLTRPEALRAATRMSRSVPRMPAAASAR